MKVGLGVSIVPIRKGNLNLKKTVKDEYISFYSSYKEGKPYSNTSINSIISCFYSSYKEGKHNFLERIKIYSIRVSIVPIRKGNMSCACTESIRNCRFYSSYKEGKLSFITSFLLITAFLWFL